MKTIERMASNRPDKASVVYPAEICRAEWSLTNPPSAVGLKLLLLLVSALGDALADDRLHELPLSLLRQVPGLAGMSKVDLERVLDDLMSTRARLDARDANDPKRGTVSFGPVLWSVAINYSDDAVLACQVRFGEVFRAMVAASELFAVIDRALAFQMKSRYSLLLYQFLATHWRKDHQRQIKLPLADLRRLFALPSDVHSEFKALRRHVLDKAVSEISAASQFTVTAKPYYEGSRAVAGVFLSWEAKASKKPAKAAPAISAAKGGKAKDKPFVSRKPSASAKAPSDSEDILAMYADMVKNSRRSLAATIKPKMARDLLAKGLVSADELKARGVSA
jgi:hypothetical protein